MADDGIERNLGEQPIALGRVVSGDRDVRYVNAS